MAREGGYALAAALVAVAAFGYIAFEVLAADRGQIVGVGARVERARLEAAADAGMMLAIHNLGGPDPTRHWPIDGRVEQADFDGMPLTITVQDERGKVPLDGLNPSQSRTLFEEAGASDDRLDRLVDELRDFQSADEDSLAPAGAALGQPAPLAPARQGGFRTVGDLMALKDITIPIFERIAPAVTTYFEESGPFESRNAGALARTTMATDEDPPDPPAQGSDLADQPPVEAAPVDVSLIGRTLTVSAVARDGRGAEAHRTAIVELTGAKEAPYWIRYVE